MPTLGVLWRRPATTLLQRAPARARPSLNPFRRPNPTTRTHTQRFQSSDSKPPNPTTTPPSSHRISRILTSASRFLPQRLRTALQDLRSAPLSHIIAFLALHELTAIVPVLGLTYAFYKLDYVPVPWLVPEDGLKKWTRYFRKKGWFGLGPEEEQQGEEESIDGDARERRRGDIRAYLEKGERLGVHNSTSVPSSAETAPDWKSRAAAVLWDGSPQPKATVTFPPAWEPAPEAENTEAPKTLITNFHKIPLQVVAAYTITKMLLVPRMALSLWMTPWLARAFVGFRQALRRKRG
ncbi:hypothetical protein F4859DRAFT_457935 [Xylaria cf. heliscus]|nr:hypothetical protein F4859DRAFT_457935 [Xylaria cf. heliscus]